MEAHESFWLATSPSTSYPALDRDLHVDVAVVGGGIVGVTTALLLAKEGPTVALVEADRVVGGVTGHTTAKVTSLHTLIYAELAQRLDEDAARLYGEANEAGLETIRRLCTEHDIDACKDLSWLDGDRRCASVGQPRCARDDHPRSGTKTPDPVVAIRRGGPDRGRPPIAGKLRRLAASADASSDGGRNLGGRPRDQRTRRRDRWDRPDRHAELTARNELGIAARTRSRDRHRHRGRAGEPAQLVPIDQRRLLGRIRPRADTVRQFRG